MVFDAMHNAGFPKSYTAEDFVGPLPPSERTITTVIATLYNVLTAVESKKPRVSIENARDTFRMKTKTRKPISVHHKTSGTIEEKEEEEDSTATSPVTPTTATTTVVDREKWMQVSDLFGQVFLQLTYL